MQVAYLKVGNFARKDETREVRSPTQLLETVIEWGRKGLTLQRYKGLGEMNPQQLVGNHAGRERPHAAARESRSMPTRPTTSSPS